MTIKRSFINYMESLGFGVFNTSLYLDGAPLNVSPCWWVLGAGGTPISTNKTGERLKNYVMNVYYRDVNAQTVDEQMHLFEETLNTQNCDQLEGFDTVDISVLTFPSDMDLDVQDRTVGVAQVTIQTHL